MPDWTNPQILSEPLIMRIPEAITKATKYKSILQSLQATKNWPAEKPQTVPVFEFKCRVISRGCFIPTPPRGCYPFQPHIFEASAVSFEIQGFDGKEFAERHDQIWRI